MYQTIFSVLKSLSYWHGHVLDILYVESSLNLTLQLFSIIKSSTE